MNEEGDFMRRNSNIKKSILPYICLFLFMMGVLYFFNIANRKVNNLTYDELLNAISESQVEELHMVPSSAGGVYEVSGIMKDYEEKESFFVRVPLTDSVASTLTDASVEYGFKLTTKADPDSLRSGQTPYPCGFLGPELPDCHTLRYTLRYQKPWWGFFPAGHSPHGR